MSDHDHNDEGSGVSRRRVLECMTWAGTGVLWTITGGVPRSLGIVGSVAVAWMRGLSSTLTTTWVGVPPVMDTEVEPQLVDPLRALTVQVPAASPP